MPLTKYNPILGEKSAFWTGVSYSDGHSRANEQEVTRQIARGEKKSTLLIVGIFYNKTKCKIQILRGYDIKIARDSRNVELCQNVGDCHRIHGNHSFSGLLGPHYKNYIYRYEL